MLVAEFAAQQSAGVVGNTPQPLLHRLRIFLRPGLGIVLLLFAFGVIPLPLLAYRIAVLRGCDVDKPRNLAKSVTVE